MLADPVKSHGLTQFDVFHQRFLARRRYAAFRPIALVEHKPGIKGNVIQKQFAKDGIGVIIISDEVEEIVSNCNRVIVMFNGEIVKEYSEEEMKVPDIKHQINELVESGKIGGERGQEA